MSRISVTLIIGFLAGVPGVLAQTQEITALPPPLERIVENWSAQKQPWWPVPQDHHGPTVGKHLTLESFGYSLAPTGPGFESATSLTPGAFTLGGLECPRCLIRPAMERTRYTLPPFGAQLTWKRWGGRAELFSSFSGINAWKPDNTILDFSGGQYRRDRSFNDAWLVQGVAGGRVAVDSGQHLWLGAEVRYVQNTGAGKQHWNSYEISATFQFGRAVFAHAAPHGWKTRAQRYSREKQTVMAKRTSRSTP